MAEYGDEDSLGRPDKWNGYRCCTGPDHILFWDYTGNIPQPNVAKGWDVSDDGRSYTLYLREGMKWSDGDAIYCGRLHVLVRKDVPQRRTGPYKVILVSH